MAKLTKNYGLKKPEGKDAYDIDAMVGANMEIIDAELHKISAPAFVQAANRDPLTTGSTHATLFGLIKKWFADLGTAAFKNVGTSSAEVAAGSHIHSAFGICTTPTVTYGNLKFCDLHGFVPSAGALVAVHFVNAATSSNFSNLIINVSYSGDYPIISPTTGNVFKIAEGTTVLLMFDGAQWIIVSEMSV